MLPLLKKYTLSATEMYWKIRDEQDPRKLDEVLREMMQPHYYTRQFDFIIDLLLERGADPNVSVENISIQNLRRLVKYGRCIKSPDAFRYQIFFELGGPYPPDFEGIPYHTESGFKKLFDPIKTIVKMLLLNNHLWEKPARLIGELMFS